jgi:hypothetical protein
MMLAEVVGEYVTHKQSNGHALLHRSAHPQSVLPNDG